MTEQILDPPRWSLMFRTVLSLLLGLLLVGSVRAEPTFSHAAFTQVLAKFVDTRGNVDYKGIVADPGGLDGYLSSLASTSPSSHPARFPTRDDRLSYYINAYNAFAIRGVTNRPGISTVDAVKDAFFVTTTWVMGTTRVSLQFLENDIVRRQFPDPRIHFALNCQAAGCPRLPQEAFEPARLNAQLDQVTREFCTDPTNVRVEAGVAHISQIFEWYAGDFAPAGGAIAFINAHGGKIPSGAGVAFIPYDWTLSAQAGRRP